MVIADFTAFLYWSCLVFLFDFTVNLLFCLTNTGLKFVVICFAAEFRLVNQVEFLGLAEV